MTLIRQQKRYKAGDFMTPKQVAEILCCSDDSIRNGSIGNFKLIALKDDLKKPHYLILSEEVQEFIKRRIELADKDYKK